MSTLGQRWRWLASPALIFAAICSGRRRRLHAVPVVPDYSDCFAAMSEDHRACGYLL
jgi:hypothetical protein